MGLGLAYPWPITPTVVPEAGEAPRVTRWGASTVSFFRWWNLGFVYRLPLGRLSVVGFVEGLSCSMGSSKVVAGDQAACLIRFPAAAHHGPIAWRHAGSTVCPPMRATGRAVRRGPPLPRLGIRTDPLRPWTVGFPTSLLHAVTSWGKSWGGVGHCAQLIPRPPPGLLSRQGYK